jgi:hypothetical protein
MTYTSESSSILSPVIIIGAHRSGTSLVTRLLDDLGIFVGKKLDANHEAMFFQSINAWILRQSSGSWDNPDSVSNFLRDHENMALSQEYIEQLMHSPTASSYLGLCKYLRFGNISNLDISWGWKDPRNTYTLPFWLRLFPKAKVVHVYRHGVDVAKSLTSRSSESFARNSERYSIFKPAYSLGLKRGGFRDSLVCSSLDGSFEVWSKYIKTASNHVNNLGSQAISIQFESLIDDPMKVLTELTDFLELNPSKDKIEKSITKIASDRCLAYKRDKLSDEFSNFVREPLAAYGYSL